jgi:hypothetical protein
LNEHLEVKLLFDHAILIQHIQYLYQLYLLIIDDVDEKDNHQMLMIMNDNMDEFHNELLFAFVDVRDHRLILLIVIDHIDESMDHSIE